MVSRSNSNAGDRLRRAKSTSSTQTGSSGHHRTSTAIDPFVVRQNAEAAAAEAFHRARRAEEPRLEAYRPVPPKLQRRRSQVTGRTEGSHLEDARLGRRRSTAKKEPPREPQWSIVPARRPVGTPSDTGSEEKVITKQRSVILPPASNLQGFPTLNIPAPYLARTGYSDGSPLSHRQSTLNKTTTPTNGSGGSLQPSQRQNGQNDVFSDFDQVSESTTNDWHQALHSPHQAAPTSARALSTARDRYLLDFQQNKLRERRSFIADTVQRLRSSISSKEHRGGFDTSLPPFNYADTGMAAPQIRASSPRPELAAITGSSLPRTRKVSESLKGRLRRVFRRASRAPSGLPAQHIEAKQLHYLPLPPIPASMVSTNCYEDPFSVATHHDRFDEPPGAEERVGSFGSQHSNGDESAARSRVTSWTNSTAARTCSSSNRTADTALIDEDGRLTRSVSVSTLRKAGSFLSRPIKNKLRGASNAELNSSEESTRLYSALQERMQPSHSTSSPARSDTSPESPTPRALSTLPSQQKSGVSTPSIKGRWSALTIRPVTPDPNAHKHDILSPVIEVLSPRENCYTLDKRHESEKPDATPKSQLRRRSALRAPTPSEEQLARRIERSQNRWQAPLDESSPPPCIPARFDAVNDNPYELPSLSRRIQANVTSRDPWSRIQINGRSNYLRKDVISPSLYSRHSDGATPPPSPMKAEADHGDMLVTITSHEVRRYPISPKKPQDERPTGRDSREWRRWLSAELKDWKRDNNPEPLTLPKGDVASREASLVDSLDPDSMDQLRDDNRKSRTVSPVTNGESIGQDRRSTASRLRRASFMNERYPMMGSESSSNESAAPAPYSGRRSATPSGGVALHEEPLGEGNARQEHRCSKDKSVSKRYSAFDIATSNHNRSAYDCERRTRDNSDTRHETRLAQEQQLAADFKHKSAMRARSALDLRANYKSGRASPLRSLEVHRKTRPVGNPSILEDSTIQNICAGPYASMQTTANTYRQLSTTHPASNANKENTPPFEGSGGQPVSRSDKVSTERSKKSSARYPSTVHPTHRACTTSQYSPARSSNGTAGASPGQRLVTGWLDAKKSNENSPVAFV